MPGIGTIQGRSATTRAKANGANYPAAAADKAKPPSLHAASGKRTWRRGRAARGSPHFEDHIVTATLSENSIFSEAVAAGGTLAEEQMQVDKALTSRLRSVLAADGEPLIRLALADFLADEG